MQGAEMIIGGHSHDHAALATLDDDRQRRDLEAHADLLHRRLNPQALWTFSYPYGKTHSFNPLTTKVLQDLGFACSFTTEVGANKVGQDVFTIRRIDPKDVIV